MTAQEIFTAVKRHLLKQRKKAMQFGQCRYRGAEGTRCAVGCLIPDKLYRTRMEGDDVETIVCDWPVLYPIFGEHLELLGELQSLHDDYDVDQWRYQLRELAKEYDLK